MNTDLIRRLEKQCWNYQANCLDAEKFAESIVQDCVDILAGYRGQVTWKNEDEMHQHPISVIQKHFGVD